MIFNKSFGVKVFRLVFFEMQGINVSEIFIYNSVTQLFSDDLFSFLSIAEGGKHKSKNLMTDKTNELKKNRKSTMRIKEDLSTQ